MLASLGGASRSACDFCSARLAVKALTAFFTACVSGRSPAFSKKVSESRKD